MKIFILWFLLVTTAFAKVDLPKAYLSRRVTQQQIISHIIPSSALQAPSPRFRGEGKNEGGYLEGCKELTVDGQAISVKAKSGRWLFIHNVTAAELWLTQSGAAASRLQADNWSVCVQNNKPMEFHCVESKPGHEQEIPCGGAVFVCQWKVPKQLSAQKEVFWKVEDKSFSQLMASLNEKG